jgi:hypothetical protein
MVRAAGALLRRVAADERINDGDLDWPNIAEEIESVGRSEVHVAKPLLFQAFAYILKADAWPLLQTASSWPTNARSFRSQARGRLTPSMCQRIDMAGLYADAPRAVPETMDGQPPPLPLPTVCLVTLDELLSEP